MMKDNYMLIRDYTYVGKMSLWNSKRLLRKLKQIYGILFSHTLYMKLNFT